MPLFLIGYRGTGKTTIARLLADRLGCRWLDADVELERRAGKSIAEIFATEGEPAFRQLETNVLEDLVKEQACVVALGGGVVLAEQNRELLKGHGQVVWLKGDAETLAARIAEDATTSARRPNLTSTGGVTEVRLLLALREPWYRECRTFEIDTVKRSPDSIVDEIFRRLPTATGGSELL